MISKLRFELSFKNISQLEDKLNFCKLNKIREEKVLNVKLGIAYNPYLKKFYNDSSERERFDSKFSSGLINSIWFQYGTDIKEIQNEVNYLKKVAKQEKINLFGSLLIPSKQFLARFKYRPWKGVHISEKFLGSLDDFYGFTRNLVSFYKNNNITPVIETDFASSEKLDSVYSFFRNER